MAVAEYAARAFGLRPHAHEPPPVAALPLPGPGEIFAVTGPSGAGKTRALNALGAALVVEPAPAWQLERPVLALIEGVPDDVAWRALAACGLADGRLWSLRAGQLSAGEQQRLWLARAVAKMGSGSGGSSPVPDPLLMFGKREPGIAKTGSGTGMRPPEPDPVLIADEFDAHLDFDTARAIAENLRRLAQTLKLRVVVSTHRPELLPWLGPARVLRIDDGLHELAAPASRRIADELTFEPGRLADWARFARWHYLGDGRPGPTAAVWLAKLAGRAVGIALFCYPHLLLSARKDVLPLPCAPKEVLAHGAKHLNTNVRLLSRVVVDPRLRGCGVASTLLRHALPTLGVPYVECIAQMGEFTGFLQRAGFERAGQVSPPRAVTRLRDFLAANNLDAHELLDAQVRAALCERHPKLNRLLCALANSRIETGHGSLRVGHGDREAALGAALSRLYARPGYFVWCGDAN